MATCRRGEETKKKSQTVILHVPIPAHKGNIHKSYVKYGGVAFSAENLQYLPNNAT